MLGLILRLALLTLAANRIHRVVGAVLFLTCGVGVVGSALIRAQMASIQRGVVESLAGDLQVYSAASKLPLRLFGDDAETALTAFDFRRADEALKRVPEVERVVPMGLAGTDFDSDNALDQLLGDLRIELGKSAPARPASFEARARHLRRLMGQLKQQLQAAEGTALERSADGLAAIEKATSDGFWARFEADPLAGLDFLDNEIAPLLREGEVTPFRYLGTDIQTFREAFPRLRLIEGAWVPPGQPGVLVSKRFYEDRLKLKLARRMDQLRAALAEGRRLEDDAELKEWTARLPDCFDQLLYQLDDERAELATTRLRTELGPRAAAGADLRTLLTALFQLDAGNFERRFNFFYEQLAPLVPLYTKKVGDTLVIRNVGPGGSVRSVRLKIWGTIGFEGFERSDVLGTINIVDLQTFQTLLGFLSPEAQREVDELRKQANMRSIDPTKADELLFGGDDPGASDVQVQTGFDDRAILAGARDHQTDGPPAAAAPPMVLNAAIFLRPQSNGESARAHVRTAVEALNLKTIDWVEASGNLGQFLVLARGALLAMIISIFLVGALILNNALMIASLGRTREIGTMRAIGASRAVVMASVLCETVLLATLSGGAGALSGGIVAAVLGARGVPDLVLNGPLLRPGASLGDVALAVVPVLLISVFASLYPVRQAATVSPLTAMQAETQ